MKLNIRLPNNLEAPHDAREFVDRLELPQPLRADVQLLTHELVSNSVRHSGADPKSSIELSLEYEDESLRVEVLDAGRGFVAEADVPRSRREGGMGLHLVEMLAERWGVERRDGTCVWFEIGAPSTVVLEQRVQGLEGVYS